LPVVNEKHEEKAGAASGMAAEESREGMDGDLQRFLGGGSSSPGERAIGVPKREYTLRQAHKVASNQALKAFGFSNLLKIVPQLLAPSDGAKVRAKGA
jgi:hypothetical protein